MWRRCALRLHKNNEFKMITNYIVVFAQVSFKATVRLKTK